MIKYSLRCGEGHAFDSWFASADAYDTLARAGRLTCAVCGGTGVEKALMAPRVRVSEKPRAEAHAPRAEQADTGEDTAPAPTERGRRLADPASQAEAAYRAFRAKLEANTEDVGRRFVEEARAIHEGRAQDRPIRGEAKIAEARKLAEEGVPVLPLPGPPTRRVN